MPHTRSSDNREELAVTRSNLPRIPPLPRFVDWQTTKIRTQAMTRPYLLLAIVLLSSMSLAAEEWAPQPVTVDDPHLASFLDESDEAKPPKVPAEEGAEGSSEEKPESESAAATLGGKAQSACDYYPICNCGCRIGCMDRWCVCDSTCCTTDEYCMHPCGCSDGDCRLMPDGTWMSNMGWCDVGGPPPMTAQSAVRFGWWGVTSNGSPTRIGEYQSLQSSPFWDVDTIRSNGVQTLDLWMTQLDNEAYDARANFYGPNVTGKFRYDHFLRRWDHDPLYGFNSTPPSIGPPGPPPGPANNVVTTDTNVGQDYAIRVQQLEAKFQGYLRDNVKWRLNVWGMEKTGERQSNAMAHCFNFNANAAPGANGNVCHLLSQKQNVDWLTMEVQPVLEVRFDNVTVEYSHTLRSFGQGDQLIDRQYTRFNFNLPAASQALGPDYYYAIVPDNMTNIDRMKVLAQLDDVNQLYANMYLGNTENQVRDTNRQFGGYDFRLINTALDNTTLTAYTSMYDENNQDPPFFYNSAPYSPANNYDRLSARHPVDYQRTRAGLKSAYRPYADDPYWRYWNLTSGYEYYQIARDYATYPTALGAFTQPDSNMHSFDLGSSMRWTTTVDSFIRYKASFVDYPLIGVRENSGGLNTNLPEQVHRVDLGGTWSPAENLVATGQVGVMNAWNHSDYTNFGETNYPIITSLWYAPTPKLSTTLGYAYFTNWIDQDITLGFTTPNVPVPPVRTETSQWSYGGENHVANVSLNYAWQPNVQLVGGFEYDHGRNTFFVPASIAGANWSALPSIAGVVANTMRWTAGADWQPYDRMNTYVRYIYFDWQDASQNLYSGTAHMALAGASYVW